MILKLLTKVELMHHPVIPNVKTFILDNFRSLSHTFKEERPDVEFTIKLNNLNKDANVLAYNDSNTITFNTVIINKFLMLLDTANAQKTFLILLITHELYHSIYPFNPMNTTTTRTDYEYQINKFSREMLDRRFKLFKYAVLKQSVERQFRFDNKHKKEKDFSNPVYKAVKETLLFPVSMEEIDNIGVLSQNERKDVQ